LNYKTENYRRRKRERESAVHKPAENDIDSDAGDGSDFEVESVVDESSSDESGDDEDESLSRDESDDESEVDLSSPIRAHTNLTKATRKPKIKISLEAFKEKEAQREKFINTLFQAKDVKSRQTQALKDFDQAVECGVFVHRDKMSGLGPEAGLERLVLDRLDHFQTWSNSDIDGLLKANKLPIPDARSQKFIKLLSRTCGVGEHVVQRMSQLYTKKGKDYVTGRTLYSKPGPKILDVCGKFTFNHLLVLSAHINSLTRFNCDRSTPMIALWMSRLERAGEPIPELVEYLKGDFCYLKPDHRALLLPACEHSPGPIEVNGQDVFRAIKKISSSTLFPDEFYFGDRTKQVTTGASTTESEEARLLAKMKYAAVLIINKRLRVFLASDFTPGSGATVSPTTRLPSFQCIYEVVFMDESWVTVGMRPTLTWNSRNGEPQDTGRGSGI